MRLPIMRIRFFHVCGYSLLIWLLVACGCVKPRTMPITVTPRVLVLANFDSLLEMNDVDDSLFGPWHGFPDDLTQDCRVEFVPRGRDGKGYCLKIKYDVESPNVAYCGLWFKFKDLEWRLYNKLSFWVRGDPDEWFTKQFKVEVKSKEQSSSKIVENVEDGWKKIEIPLHWFRWYDVCETIDELIFVFVDTEVTEKEGVIYLDDIALEK